MNRAQIVAQELLIRDAAKESIYPFLDLMRETGLPDFIHKPAEHHRLMIEVIHDMVNGKEDRATFAFPPGAAKSTYTSIIAPVWLLAKDPTLQIVCVSNSQSLAESFSRRRRNAMLTKQWERISETQLLADAKSLEYQGTPEGGGIRCLGAGSTVTGFRADWIFADDLIVGHEQASSLQQLDKIWNWFLSELRSRLKPNGRLLMVGTRWAQLDPIGRAYDLYHDEIEEWRHIRVPMLADQPNDPLGRQTGERLWAEWFTDKMVRDAQRDPQIWQCLYQQTPMDYEGSWVEPDKFQIVRALPAGLKYYIGIDLALSIQKGDYTVIAVVAMDVQKGLYVVDMFRDQCSPEKSVQALIALADKYEPAGVFIDNDGASKVWGNLVWQATRDRGKAIPVQLIPMQNKDKETRAAALRAFLLNGAIAFKQALWNSECFDEMAKFPGGRHDDIVDAIAIVCRQFPKLSAPTNPGTRAAQIQRMLVPHQGGFAINSSLDEMFEAREKPRYNRNRI
ncbi:phage terminase large subunit [Microbulbifer sp. ALW1]|uniref:phage terminase large subunit n=1 Tax=Microbulbifer sp. (strain ALW1) TaxID=1516059 RepID=UPI00135A3D9C|nr:phage terminase large subunit [Microbulbifer sp. ALW1]